MRGFPFLFRASVPSFMRGFPFLFRASVPSFMRGFHASVSFFVLAFVLPFLGSCVLSCFFPPAVRFACCKACTRPYDLQDTQRNSSATELGGGTT
jgi:hypothetical protein